MNQDRKKIHFIAIGGSAMHNLAIALHQQGHEITGSDDEIFEPSKSYLAKYKLLPEKTGWFAEKIHANLNAVILGMHARLDNPELIAAQKLGLKIYSYPEFVYEQCKDKQRIVIGGSHGKTTITSIILHVLKSYHRNFDYLVGARLEDFDVMVKLTKEAPLIIIEGDEYLASPLDTKPKFLLYQHHIGVISGIAWDHMNVFPTFDDYIKQFEAFAEATPKGGMLIFNEEDDVASVICKKERDDVLRIDYDAHDSKIIDAQTYLVTREWGDIPIQIFGKHNMLNISAAKAVCMKIGISEEQFYKAIATFKGAANRLEIVHKNNNTVVFKDFAHAPSKLEATTEAVKQQFPNRKLVACLELHTFSSLHKEFLKQYKNTFKQADMPIVYFNPHTIAHKKLAPIQAEEIKQAFNQPNLLVFDDMTQLKSYLETQNWKDTNLLLMSSGNFDQLNLKELAQTITNN